MADADGMQGGAFSRSSSITETASGAGAAVGQSFSAIDGRAVFPHDIVLNRPPGFEDFNAFTGDTVLTEAVKREGADWITPRARAAGQLAGGQAGRWGRDVNTYTPTLRVFDSEGRRLDEVVYHPSWHQLLRAGIQYGLHNLPWVDDRTGAHAARAALLFLMGQADTGYLAPLSATHAAVACLDQAPDLARLWTPRLTYMGYEPELRAINAKRAALCGMAITEKQSGTDLEASVTRARAIGPGAAGPVYELTGHKWFYSAPMTDAMIATAMTQDGLSCFLVPRCRDDGSLNRVHLQRLKNTLGNRSVGAAEIEFHGAEAIRIGDEGAGAEMLATMRDRLRLDQAVSAAAVLRRALVQLMHHVTYRHVAGKPLIEQPLMRAILTDLALEAEAATVSVIRLASFMDRTKAEPAFAPVARACFAIFRFWLAKRLPAALSEAIECMGADGFSEDGAMPRLYRDAPQFGIWFGGSNNDCLTVAALLLERPEVFEGLIAEIEPAVSMNARLQSGFNRLKDMARHPGGTHLRDARRVTLALAILLQAAWLCRFSPSPVGDGFAISRLDDSNGLGVFGTGTPPAYDKVILERAAWHS